jgi:hypothetical protein
MMQFTIVAVTLFSAILANGKPAPASPPPPPSPPSASGCKTFPGDKAWPLQPDWDAFNKTVGGRLIATVPLGTPCHGSAFNNATCESLKSQWQTEQIQYVSSQLS